MAKNSKGKVTISREDLESFVEMDEERKAAQRKADDLEKQLKPLKEKLMKFTLDKGGYNKVVGKLGHSLSVVKVKGQPSWKVEFLNLAGQDKVDEVTANCPPSDRLFVVPKS